MHGAENVVKIVSGVRNPDSQLLKLILMLLPNLFDMGIKAIMTGNFLTTMGSSKKMT